MFTKTAAFYDKIYSFKDYAKESAILHTLIQEYKRAPGSRLLDAACGTGQHLAHLREHYTVEGFDLDADLLNAARERLPDVPLRHADMIDFDFGRTYDVITCLFSAIGYVITDEALKRTIANMAQHLHTGGVLLVEPWLYPEHFNAPSIHGLYIDEPNLKIVRLSHSTIENGVSYLNFEYLIGTPDGITHEKERHGLGLFKRDQYQAAFEAAGLITAYHMVGLDGRGMWIGVKPA
ncbi:MAG: class I SAM-dependent methyltransferase [Anaerolineae bacterium]